MRESTTEHYPQYPVDGPLSCLSADVAGPVAVAHELLVLVETLQTAGSYDQLNLGGVAALKVVARRVQLITEAYANPQESDWDTSKFFSGCLRSRRRPESGAQAVRAQEGEGCGRRGELSFTWTRREGSRTLATSTRAPPWATTRRKAAVVVEVGSSHDEFGALRQTSAAVTNFDTR